MAISVSVVGAARRCETALEVHDPPQRFGTVSKDFPSASLWGTLTQFWPTTHLEDFELLSDVLDRSSHLTRTSVHDVLMDHPNALSSPHERQARTMSGLVARQLTG
ncbi:hypothetical protein MF271_00870 (plasmid) [Deinococcus sp. KNUC1210]|uniref:hypothetical protein n=1 Tax=Deinococcus sp. KNUC1210 TaxID=2917691 RepID=UPI001EEFCA7D|nr:hypothetical protein [Deinococcus sp. KNUC1210]ULH14063.1 hypothetical protein MF271_00870 [Deinococcus sp. KNUC1210]